MTKVIVLLLTLILSNLSFGQDLPPTEENLHPNFEDIKMPSSNQSLGWPTSPVLLDNDTNGFGYNHYQSSDSDALAACKQIDWQTAFSTLGTGQFSAQTYSDKPDLFCDIFAKHASAFTFKAYRCSSEWQ